MNFGNNRNFNGESYRFYILHPFKNIFFWLVSSFKSFISFCCSAQTSLNYGWAITDKGIFIHLIIRNILFFETTDSKTISSKTMSLIQFSLCRKFLNI